MIIAFLGVDGSGKSTVIEQFTRKVHSDWSEIKYIHFRPNLFLKSSSNGPVTNPHEGKSRGLFVSMIKSIYFIIEYNVAFIFNYFNPGQLIIYDRYSYDIIADPQRTKFSLPSWLSRAMIWIIPSPNLIFYLHAPVDVLYERKKEINKSDLSAILDKYLILSKVHKFHEIDTNTPLEETIDKILLIYYKSTNSSV
mgnify:CR=1 FL=1|tara:strand:- start:1170 stop:1754 length:585 start_codon:yes stop_codon:yes gene_type:complete